MIKHVVMLKFKKSASESAITEVEKELAGLPAIIPDAMKFEIGRDVVHSARSYDFALVCEFENLAKLEGYRVHPAHQKVVVKLLEICDSILVVDFEI
jgi:type II secretory pathway component PulC